MTIDMEEKKQKKELEETGFGPDSGLDLYEEDSFYGYILLAVCIMLSSLLMGFGLLRITPDILWLECIAAVLIALLWLVTLLSALFLITGIIIRLLRYLTGLVIRIRRKRQRKNNHQPKD